MENMNTTISSDIKVNAIDLITEQLGSVVSDGYVEFYKTKNDDEVLVSVSDLMIEVLGEKRAKEELKKYHLLVADKN